MLPQLPLDVRREVRTASGRCVKGANSLVLVLSGFFFFQAEDGIRDLTVTGVQTCALPIYRGPPQRAARVRPHERGVPRDGPQPRRGRRGEPRERVEDVPTRDTPAAAAERRDRKSVV